ncbi:MAG: N-acetylmuramoyl-L-alanine amidase [Alphaproteobacteria bacterium]|nr:N-acetylmuramoyl-L-alanine amidase [Alphaproteobacteria bacterium]
MARWRVRRIAFLILLMGAWWPGAVAAEPSVLGVRAGEHLTMTRFVLDLSERVEFQIFTLANPYRIVIDLPEMNWQIPPHALEKGKGVIQGFRYGLFTAGTSRVVLDVNRPVTVKKAFLLNPIGQHSYRFVLDLEAVSKEAFEHSRDKAAPPKVAALPVPPPASKNGAKPLVVIDPGHGGVDPGALSGSGLQEKGVTLDVARKLKQKLEATGRYRAMLTRDRDIFIPLRSRVAMAREAEADLFISLHADSHPNHRTMGASIYTLSEKASDKEAAAQAANENKADIIAGMDFSGTDPVLADILIDIAQRDSLNSSLSFCYLLIKEMGKVTRLVRNTRRSAGFAVLKAPDIPSVLVEMGYLSNRQEEKLLRDGGHRSRLADAIVKATDRFFAGRDL